MCSRCLRAVALEIDSLRADLPIGQPGRYLSYQVLLSRGEREFGDVTLARGRIQAVRHHRTLAQRNSAKEARATTS